VFDITQVIGLTNDDAVSKEYRWVKQVIERLNRTFKSSYRVTCGYGSEDGALNGFPFGLPTTTSFALILTTIGGH